MSGADRKLGKPTRMHMHLPSYAQEEYIRNREIAREEWFKKYGETLSIGEIMLRGLKCLCDQLTSKDAEEGKRDLYKYNRIRN
jgi:hypothetical protein